MIEKQNDALLINVKPSEHNRWRLCAKRAGQSKTAWIREILNKSADYFLGSEAPEIPQKLPLQLPDTVFTCQYCGNLFLAGSGKWCGGDHCKVTGKGDRRVDPSTEPAPNAESETLKAELIRRHTLGLPLTVACECCGREFSPIRIGQVECGCRQYVVD